jgi:hypothetical protein
MSSQPSAGNRPHRRRERTRLVAPLADGDEQGQRLLRLPELEVQPGGQPAARAAEAVDPCSVSTPTGGPFGRSLLSFALRRRLVAAGDGGAARQATHSNVLMPGCDI